MENNSNDFHIVDFEQPLYLFGFCVLSVFCLPRLAVAPPYLPHGQSHLLLFMGYDLFKIEHCPQTCIKA